MKKWPLSWVFQQALPSLIFLKPGNSYKKYCLNKTNCKDLKMLSEEFDKKVKEAADHHHPSYDEKAWEKMEKLLNKHLPQKKDDRRKYILLLLLFLIMGGGVYLM